MTKQRKMLLILAIIGSVGFFLPWAAASELRTDEILEYFVYGFQLPHPVMQFAILLAFLATGVLALTGDRLAKLPMGATVFVISCAVLNVLLIGWWYMELDLELFDQRLRRTATPAFGMGMSFLAALGTLLALLIAWFFEPTPTRPNK